ncbi:hypothetical protein AGMMS49574_15300 [Bacteroidia bacterium]|nr:hypothetical protein AGMMS49574_15300 [Bacteroidia bacterium]
MENITPIKPSRKLDFSNAQDCNKIYSLYGGETRMKAELPALYDLIQRTRNYCQKNNPLNAIKDDGGFQDCAYIDYIEYDAENKIVYAKAIVSLTVQAFWIDSKIELTTGNGEYIHTEYLTTENAFRQEMTIVVPNIDESQFTSKLIDAKLTSLWHSSQSKMLESQEAEDQSIINSDDIIGQITVNDPNHIKTSTDDFIKVVYNRTPGDKEIVDYDYPQGPIGGSQPLFLDCYGSATLTEGKTFDKIGALNLLVDSQKGVAYYKNDISNRIYATANGFEWKLNNDWQNNVPTSRLPQRDPVYFRMKLNFYCKGDDNEYDITIASDINPITSNIKQISQLLLLWGCCAEDTKILMSDGKTKNISDISIGDEVVSIPQKLMARVTNVWKGKESSLICIRSKSLGEIKVTNQHPLITKEGIKAAEDLNGNDKLLIQDGRYDDICNIYIINDYKGFVYNLTLETDKLDSKGLSMIGNGYVIGDNNMQGQIINSSHTASIKYLDDDDLINDIKKILTHKNQRR